MNTARTVRLITASLSLAASAALTLGCAATDVVAKYAATSFGVIAKAMEAAEENGYLMIESPAGDLFGLARDFSGNLDAVLSIDAAPFIKAGVDVARLPGDAGSVWAVENGRLVGRFDLASGGKAPSKEPKAIVAALALANRGRIGYHAQMGHYGVMLDDHAMVEWAADAQKNDKDWVLVLDPGLVSVAGGKPEAVEGWILAMVPVDGPDGKMIEVQKLLRPTNIIN
jgi:hypothetical protein